jgi:hypothetical protein
MTIGASTRNEKLFTVMRAILLQETTTLTIKKQDEN